MDGRNTHKYLWPRVSTLVQTQNTQRETSANPNAVSQSWDFGLRDHFEYDSEDCPKIITIGGGKGGVGKSFVSANLAVAISELKLKVLLIDLDFGGANLHTYFSAIVPKLNISDYLSHSDLDLMDVSISTKLPNLRLVVNGRTGVPSELLGKAGVFKKLWAEVIQLKANNEIDVVVFDLGAGSHPYNLDFFSAAHIGVLTVLPEPTSIENAYVFLKASLIYSIEKLGHRLGLVAAATDLQSLISKSNPSIQNGGYRALLESQQSTYPHLINAFFKMKKSHHLKLLLNQTRDFKDKQVGESMARICDLYFGYHVPTPNFLSHDDAAWKSLRNRSLLCDKFPHSNIQKQIQHVAKSFVDELDLLEGSTR